MIVPRYWAEGRVQRRDGRRQVTIRPYGWSDVSAADAQANADTRANEAMARAAWVAEYERAASGYAACRFTETLGNAVVHPDVRPVLELHDSLSRANTALPIA